MKVKITTVYDSQFFKWRNLGAFNGVSFHISINQEQIISDLGLIGWRLLRNMKNLNIIPNEIDKVFLTHGHMDHVRGLIGLVSARTTSNKLLIFTHPDATIQRYSFIGNRKIWNAGFPIFEPEIEEKVQFSFNKESIQIAPKLFTTGEISLKKRTNIQNLSRHYKCKTKDSWEHDPVADDQSLVLQTSEGLVLITGCCHSGLLNTCNKAKELFNDEIHAVIGGVHMVFSRKQKVEQVINNIKRELKNPILYLNHSTGTKAIRMMKKEFGNNVARNCSVGTTIEFDC
jgi:7,8-dihydropterin-6-yl-methyl-4-(beta-D-ribofuranosyl)aminobenzene 5'-phosphate synthase